MLRPNMGELQLVTTDFVDSNYLSFTILLNYCFSL